MTWLQFVALSLYALGMILGQILFKVSSQHLADGALSTKLISLLLNPAFLLALSLYFGLSLVWVWILSFTPLSRAYPFVAIAMVLTPLIGAALFQEPVTPIFLIGLVLFGVGLYLIATSSG
jgi:drug/metabolite transporter (DMT)-like permease